MEPKQAEELILKCFEQSCNDFFKRFNLGNLERIEQVHFSASNTPTATIDAGADDFEVLISFHLPFSVLEMTFPSQANINTIDESELEDWACELSNQFVGCLNINLNRHGSRMKTGLPEYTYGTDEDLDDSGLHKYLFSLDGEVFQAVISTELLGQNIALHTGTLDSEKIVTGEIDFF